MEEFVLIYMKLNKIFQDIDVDPALKNLKGQNHNIYLNYLIKFLKNPFRLFNFIKRIIVFVLNTIDYLNSCKKIKSNNFKKKNKKILLICLQGLPYQYIQIWNIIYKKIFDEYKIEALSNKRNYLINIFLYLCKIKIIYIEEINKIKNIDVSINDLKNIKTEQDYLNFKYESFEIGKTALATYFRAKCSGDIIINDVTKKDLDNIIFSLISNYNNFKKFFSKSDIFLIFITEVFIEEYASIALAALKTNLILTRFNFTAKDDSMIINKISEMNYRRHHATITSESFKFLKSNLNEKTINEFLESNFKDRYSSKWHLSKRNELKKKELSETEIFKNLNINKNKKIGIIFSHILYDLIYAYGEDIYLNYFNWLGKTLEIVDKFENTQWLLKIHPANVWRYEINKQLKEISEELRVVRKFCDGKLKNVKIIDYGTNISPLKIMEIADLCVTVRGTSGLEMATMGKQVISAGTGRYDGFGFINTPKSVEEYEKLLNDFENSNFNDFLNINDVKKNSKIFYYGLFKCKPINLPFIEVKKQKLKNKVLSMSDLNYNYDDLKIKNSNNLKKYLLDKKNNIDLFDKT